MTGTLNNRLFWLWSVGVLVAYIGAILLVAIACVIYAGVGNITAAILSEELRFSTKLSVLTATVSTILSLIVGIPAAYALAQYRGRFKALVDTLLDLPIVLPPIALGVALLVFFTQFPSQTSSVEKWLEALGRPIVYEVPAIVVAQFAVVSGYALRILKAAFESQDPRLRDVARTLGLSQWKIFFWIELPQSTTSLMAATVLLWARAMGEFGATVVLAGATPGKTDVLPISIYLALNRAEIDKALAASVVLILVAVAALFLFRKFVQRAV
ncbi:ABC transporter permease [Fervidibacter sacchari]|uniref:Molybdate transport system permease protein n=1 Tax=Candidatus Fervidibacter sacchari TaxID=1448929 RepID=A0ABT2ELM2_9BACT|nr:ABC transporter permease [Candidatus Fervidibacter sacchari]MCS3918845.1 molybdate transport system permease protein [Candidatus Fervidibacter sacchari]WKU17409.1 ABC transporter permease [Candidatus Fervidibacter sacchari]